MRAKIFSFLIATILGVTTLGSLFAPQSIPLAYSAEETVNTAPGAPKPPGGGAINTRQGGGTGLKVENLEEAGITDKATQDCILNGKCEKRLNETESPNSGQSLDKYINLDDGGVCSLISTNGIGNLAKCGAFWAMKITGVLTQFAGTTLNFAIDLTIVNIRNNINLGVINSVWETFRDMANIIFIFVLIYIAVKTILGQTGGQLRTLIANVIIAAIFINFSLYFTKFLIDVSNIVALQFYNALTPDGITLTKNNGVGWMITDSLALNTLNYNASGEQVVLAGIIGSLFLIITAFVLFTMAILIAIRFVILIFLMVTSPIYFVGNILPQAKGPAQKWWGHLTDQLIFLPAMMAMLWVTLKFATQGGIREDLIGAGFGEIITKSGTEPGLMGILLWYIMLTAMILLSLVVAQSMGAKGGAFAQKWAGRASFGVATYLPKRMVAGGANLLSENKKFRDFASRAPFGSLMKAGVERVSKTNFDLRTPLGKVPVLGGVVGEAGRGYRDIYNQDKREQEAFQRWLGKDKVLPKDDAKEVERLKEENKGTQREIDRSDYAVSAKEDAVRKAEEALKQARNSNGDVASAQKNLDNANGALEVVKREKLYLIKRRESNLSAIKDLEKNARSRDELAVQEQDTILGKIFFGKIRSAGGTAVAEKLMKEYKEKREKEQRAWANKGGLKIISDQIGKLDEVIEKALDDVIQLRNDRIKALKEETEALTKEKDEKIRGLSNEIVKKRVQNAAPAEITNIESALKKTYQEKADAQGMHREEMVRIETEIKDARANPEKWMTDLSEERKTIIKTAVAKRGELEKDRADYATKEGDEKERERELKKIKIRRDEEEANPRKKDDREDGERKRDDSRRGSGDSSRDDGNKRN